MYLLQWLSSEYINNRKIERNAAHLHVHCTKQQPFSCSHYATVRQELCDP